MPDVGRELSVRNRFSEQHALRRIIESRNQPPLVSICQHVDDLLVVRSWVIRGSHLGLVLVRSGLSLV